MRAASSLGEIGPRRRIRRHRGWVDDGQRLAAPLVELAEHLPPVHAADRGRLRAGLRRRRVRVCVTRRNPPMVQAGQPRRDRRTGRIRPRRTRAAAPPPVRSGPRSWRGGYLASPPQCPNPENPDDHHPERDQEQRRGAPTAVVVACERRSNPANPFPWPTGRILDPRRPQVSAACGPTQPRSRPTVPIESPEARWTPPDDWSAPARSPPAPAQGSAPGSAPDGSARACTPGAMVSHAPSSPSSSPPTSPSGHGPPATSRSGVGRLEIARCRGIGHRPGRRPRLEWPVLSELHSVLPHGRRPCRPTLDLPTSCPQAVLVGLRPCGPTVSPTEHR